MSRKWTSVVSLLLLLGCQSGPPYAPSSLKKDEKPVEDQINVVVLEQDLKSRVKDIGTQATRMPDGRLKVQSRLLNTSTADMHLQIQTIYKDDKGFATEDPTPWEHTLLARGDSLNYESSSLNDKATRFVIKVREVRE